MQESNQTGPAPTAAPETLASPSGSAGDSSNKPAGKSSKMSVITKGILGLAVMVVVFSVGVSFGDGRLHLRTSDNQNKSLPAELDFSSVNQVYGILRKDYDGTLDAKKLTDGLKAGLAEATGDPYTEYFTAAQAKQFSEQLNGTGFSGIGAELGLDKDKNLIVVAPISGTPAATAGVKSQDIIAEIDGKSTSGIAIDEAISKIRGPKGSTVKLKIIRNRSETIDLSIVRDDIKVPSVDSKVVDDNIGYMHISTFGEDTGKVAAQQAQDLADKKVKAVILDLRGNPGGSVDSAIEVASLWIPKDKLIMQEKRLSGEVLDTYKASGNSILGGIPTIVLVDGGSASASEIVSGALKDSNAAKLYGEKTYGKGVVQAVEPLGDGSQLKVTIARWYRPNGQNIDKKGITPDQEVKLSDDDAKAGNDTQLQAAEAALNK